MVNWRQVDDLPDWSDFVWIVRKLATKPELAFLAKWDRVYRFQDPYTVGDSEGLSVEYYTDVLCWAELEEPPIPLDAPAEVG